MNILRNDCEIIKNIIEKLEGPLYNTNSLFVNDIIGQIINSLYFNKNHPNYLYLTNKNKSNESLIISSILKHNISINRLEIFNCNIDENLNLKELTYLNLNSCISSEILGKLFVRFNILSPIMKLTELHLKNIKNIKNLNYMILASFIKKSNLLRVLSIENCFIGDKGIKLLSDGFVINSSLTKLVLVLNFIGEKGLCYLCSKIRSTNIKEISFGQEFLDIKSIQYLFCIFNYKTFNLEKICLFNCYYDQFTIISLNQNCSLKELILPFNKINDKFLEILCDNVKSLKFLEKLDFSSNSLSNKASIFITNLLRNLKCIREFKINDNSLGDTLLSISKMVNDHKNIEIFDFTENETSMDTMKKILKIIKKSKILKLEIREKIDFKYIIKFCIRNPKIEILNVENCFVKENNYIKTLENIKSFPNLKQIKFRSCNLKGNNIISNLFNSLTNDNKLIDIDLNFCNIPDYAINYLLNESFLIKFSCLTYLSLSDNQIISENIKWLSFHFGKNNSIKVLNLNKNNICDKGAKYLSECLIVNKMLEVLNLNDNNIQIDGAIELLLSLERNNNLKCLKLRNNFVDCLKISCYLKIFQTRNTCLVSFMIDNPEINKTEISINNLYNNVKNEEDIKKFWGFI